MNKKHMTQFFLGSLLGLAPILFIGCLLNDDNENRGTIIDNEMSPKIYMVDGKTPAVGAEVKIYNINEEERVASRVVRTDKRGTYSLDGLAKGVYNVWAQSDSIGTLVSFQDSVLITDDKAFYKDDTLEIPKNIKGYIKMQKQHDPRTVTVNVLGAPKFSNVQEDGSFNIQGLATGNYNLNITTSEQGYTPTSYTLVVGPGTPSVLKDSIELIFTGIPLVTGIEISYDTLNGIVKLIWNKTKFKNIQEYVIYRDEFYTVIEPSKNGIANTMDTVYYDNLSKNPDYPFYKENYTSSYQWDPYTYNYNLVKNLQSIDVEDYKFKYRVAIRKNDTEKGNTFGYVAVDAVSPKRLKPNFQNKILHGNKDVEINKISINDTVRLVTKIKNTYRAIEKIQWVDPNKNILIKEIQFTVPRFEILDTVRYAWNSESFKVLKVVVWDNGGTAWSENTPIIDIARYSPSITKKPDTLVTGLDTAVIHVSAIDNNPDGTLEYYWDWNADGWDDTTKMPENKYRIGSCITIPVIWGAENDDGVLVKDTFDLVGNCAPETQVVKPQEGIKWWVNFNFDTGTGDLPMKIKSFQRDSTLDSIYYEFNLENEDGTPFQLIKGKGKSINEKIILNNLIPSKKYIWKIKTLDVFGVISYYEGEIISPRKPGLNSCINNQFIDVRDNWKYNCIDINGQTWMSDNLSFNFSEVVWDKQTSSSSWCSSNSDEICRKFGRIYGWNAATLDKSQQDICPEGWRLPSEIEWNNLLKFYYKPNVDNFYPELISKNDRGINTSGFNLVMGRTLYSTNWASSMTQWWSSTIKNDIPIILRAIRWDLEAEFQLFTDKSTETGSYIRCIED